MTEEELFRWCVDQLPYFALPRYIEFRAELPRSPVGRVLKRDLRAEGVTAATWDAGLRASPTSGGSVRSWPRPTGSTRSARSATRTSWPLTGSWPGRPCGPPGALPAQGMPARVFESGLMERRPSSSSTASSRRSQHESPAYQEALQALGDGAERPADHRGGRRLGLCVSGVSQRLTMPPREGGEQGFGVAVRPLRANQVHSVTTSWCSRSKPWGLSTRSTACGKSMIQAGPATTARCTATGRRGPDRPRSGRPGPRSGRTPWPGPRDRDGRSGRGAATLSSPISCMSIPSPVNSTG